MPRIIIGVMGPGSGATEVDKQNAFELGRLISLQGWVLLSGGRNEGVMDAVSQGAKSVGGLTIGIIPSSDNALTSDAVDIPILTGMGSARNNINILTSNVVIACGMGAGTASEIALALKAKKDVVLLNDDPTSKIFFQSIGDERVHLVDSPTQAIDVSLLIIEKAQKGRQS